MKELQTLEIDPDGTVCVQEKEFIKLKRVDAILAADLHLREDCPKCRTDGVDGYWAAQEKKIRFIAKLCREHDCPLLVAGDVFEHWKPSPRLLAWTLRELPPMIFVPGQHDLPQHSLELFEKSGCAVLEAVGMKDDAPRFRRAMQVEVNGKLMPVPLKVKGKTLTGAGWGEAPITATSSDILLTHQLVWQGNPPFPGAPKEGNAKTLLKKYPGYQLIVSGDNHQPFVARQKYTKPEKGSTAGWIHGSWSESLLVNPGSMMRMSADQADHKPRVYLWDAEANEIEPVYLPIEQGVVSQDHIKQAKERDARINTFVKRLKAEVDMGLDFKKNMKEYLLKNKCEKEVMKIIWEVIDE